MPQELSPAQLKRKTDQLESNQKLLNPKRIVTKDFYKNNLIQSISNDRSWTISDKNKRPMDMNYYFKNKGLDPYPWRPFHYLRNEQTGKIEVDNRTGLKKSDSLVTLDQMKPNNAPELYYCNRAYRMHACLNRIICLDIESSCEQERPDILKSLLALPAGYRERSRHDGYHLLIYIPKQLLNDKNKYIINVTNIKGPHNLFEFINNEHFVTLTRKMMRQMPLKEQASPKKQHLLKRFLAQLVAFDAPEQAKRQQNEVAFDANKSIDIQYSGQLPKKLKELAHKFPAYDTQQDQKMKPEQYGSDMSRYEFAVISRIKTQWYEYLSLCQPNLKIDKKKLTLLTYLTSANRKIIPYRAKHDTKRRGLPWLLYNAELVHIYDSSIKNIKNIQKQSENCQKRHYTKTQLESVTYNKYIVKHHKKYKNNYDYIYALIQSALNRAIKENINLGIINFDMNKLKQFICISILYQRKNDWLNDSNITLPFILSIAQNVKMSPHSQVRLMSLRFRAKNYRQIKKEFMIHKNKA